MTPRKTKRRNWEAVTEQRYGQGFCSGGGGDGGTLTVHVPASQKGRPSGGVQALHKVMSTRTG